jgi:two-component system, sporulation sensor kinase B
MLGFDNYLFAFLVVLAPVFIYYAFFYLKYTAIKKQLLIGLLCSISIILSMSYPLELAPGHIFDLRTIPWLLAFLYGGLNVGLCATGLIFIVRIIIGVDVGLIITFVAYIASGINVLFLLRKYNLSDLKQKLKISFLLTFVNTLIVISGVLFYIEEFNPSIVPIFITYFILSHLLTIIIVVYIIETLREKEMNKIKLQQSERVKLIGEMAASVAHEVKNPLTIVMGFTQLLKSEENLTEKQLSSIELIHSELQRAEKIIYDYLSLAKSKSEDVEEIDLAEVAQNVTKVMGSYAKLNQVSIVNNIQNSYYLSANQSEISQVLLNLIKNGIEAIEEKGEIILNATKTGSNVEVSITDNGKGMTDEEVDRLGTSFYTTKTSGTGLGLLVCFKIIDSHKGKIDVKSKKGEGTSFTIVLPLNNSES